MIRLIAPHSPAESYQNFPNRDTSDWRREYYAENLPRLVKVKTKYCPHNLFHNAQSIPSAHRSRHSEVHRLRIGPGTRWINATRRSPRLRHRGRRTRISSGLETAQVS